MVERKSSVKISNTVLLVTLNMFLIFEGYYDKVNYRSHSSQKYKLFGE